MLGYKIKELRVKKGWTQEQLGQAIGVSGQTVSNWEVGLYNIRNKNLDKIKRVLDWT